MRNVMKAQTQAITLVLLTAIIISMIGFAYSWGKPMIDKRSVTTQFTSSVRFMEQLDRKIVDMAGTCSFGGACEEILELPFPGIIRLDESSNSIVYEYVVNQPLISGGEVLFNTADDGDVVRYGETPGVISLTGDGMDANQYNIKFLLRYRELDSNDPPKGYKIELVRSGPASGNSKISISYDGSETRPGQAHHSGDLIVSKIKVQTI